MTKPKPGDDPTPPAVGDRHPLAKHPVDDPALDRWQASIEAEAKRAANPRSRKPFAMPGLPDFAAGAAAGVVDALASGPRALAGRTPAVLGRFLQDRGTGLVHDVTRATAACDLGAAMNGTWFHFWQEVLADPTADTPCPTCMPVGD